MKFRLVSDVQPGAPRRDGSSLSRRCAARLTITALHDDLPVGVLEVVVVSVDRATATTIAFMASTCIDGSYLSARTAAECLARGLRAAAGESGRTTVEASPAAVVAFTMALYDARTPSEARAEVRA